MKSTTTVMLAMLLAACAPAQDEAVQLDVPDPWAEFAGGGCPDGFRIIGDQCWKRCPDGQSAPAAGVDRCDVHPAAVVDRGAVMGCPGGYVDHPSNPSRCVLPVVAARAAAPRPAPVLAAAPEPVSDLNPAEREHQLRQEARIYAEEQRRVDERQRHAERRY